MQWDTQAQSHNFTVSITKGYQAKGESLDKMFHMKLNKHSQSQRKDTQIHSFPSSAQNTSSKPQKLRALTCYRVGPRHHEGRGSLWLVWNGSLGGVTWRLWCPCWCVGLLLLLLVRPGRGVGWCCCGTVGVFFSHRRTGVRPHTLCQAMASAAPQAAILTPLQAGATAVVILWRTSDGGWEEMKTEKELEQAREVRWGKEARNVRVMLFVCYEHLSVFISNEILSCNETFNFE